MPDTVVAEAEEMVSIHLIERVTKSSKPVYRSAIAVRLAVDSTWYMGFLLFGWLSRQLPHQDAHFPSSCVAESWPPDRLQIASASWSIE